MLVFAPRLTLLISLKSSLFFLENTSLLQTQNYVVCAHYPFPVPTSSFMQYLAFVPMHVVAQMSSRNPSLNTESSFSPHCHIFLIFVAFDTVETCTDNCVYLCFLLKV